MDKCLAFCQTLAMSNQRFTFSLSLGKDSFNFSNKELVESSWKLKKKSPSQKRREEKRKLERSKKQVAEKVTEVYVPKVNEIEDTVYFNCDQCDFKSASEKGLRHHVSMQHKISQLDGDDDTGLKVIEVEIKQIKNPCPLCKDDGVSCTGKCRYPRGTCEDLRNITELDIIHHIMNEHEPTEVLGHFGQDYVMKHQSIIRRRLDYIQEASHSAKWDMII